MNILEAYIKKYGQIIILILGLPCTNKSEIAKELGIELNLPILKINDYLIENKYTEKKIENTNFKLYEDSDNYDWEKLNEKVNELKTSGVIVYGNYLDRDKIDWESDFSFFYSMNYNLCKNILLEKKMLDSNYSQDDIKIYFEKIFNPLYKKIKLEFVINKFFNIKETTTFDESFDNIFDTLMDLISKKVYKI